MDDLMKLLRHTVPCVSRGPRVSEVMLQGLQIKSLYVFLQAAPSQVVQSLLPVWGGPSMNRLGLRVSCIGQGSFLQEDVHRAIGYSYCVSGVAHMCQLF